MRSDATTILKQFEAASAIYRAHMMDPSWEAFRAWEADAWDGLGIFLGEYAFEHQGRSPDFPAAAVQVIESLKGDSWSLGDRNAPGEAWRRFGNRLPQRTGEPRLNEGGNPLAPQSSQYEIQRKKMIVKRQTKKKSAIEVAADQPLSFPCTVGDLMARGDASAAHALVKAVNGINDKIASFFLRDVACKTGINVPRNRHVLQPIDIWVRRSARIAFDEPALDAAPFTEVARKVVDECEKTRVNAEHVNQGMWYFGAVVCRSEIKLMQALDDADEFRATLVAYGQALGAARAACSSASMAV